MKIENCMLSVEYLISIVSWCFYKKTFNKQHTIINKQVNSIK